MATKITKSELKNMIREALREELSKTKLCETKLRLKETNNVCLICGKPIDKRDGYCNTIFGPVHDDTCWDEFTDTDEWLADNYHTFAIGESDDFIIPDGADADWSSDVTESAAMAEEAWKRLRSAGKLPFSVAECSEIEQEFKARLNSADNTTIYITYDRYEHDEWFIIYHVDTDRQSAIRHCKEHDLFDFISYGPDDCHAFQLQKVELPDEVYKAFFSLSDEFDDTIDSGELYDIMVDIFDEAYDTETLIYTDGPSDNDEIVHYYGKQQQLDTQDEDTYDDLQQELFSDDVLYSKVLKAYIKDKY